ncbi:unnamed protein product [Prunus brigantina]
MALGTPEHGGRVRGVRAGVSPTQFFNLPQIRRAKFTPATEKQIRCAKLQNLARRNIHAKILSTTNKRIVAQMRMFAPNHSDPCLPNTDFNHFPSALTMVERPRKSCLCICLYVFEEGKMLDKTQRFPFMNRCPSREEPVSARRRHRPASTTDTTSTDGS